MKILLIDAKNMAHRAFHAYRNLQNHGKPVSIVYGMPSMISSMLHQFRPDKCFIVWDGARSKHRLKLLPEYKAGRRTHTDEERAAFDKQIRTTMLLLHSLGLKQIIHPEQEADDMIYKLVRLYKKNKKNTIIIISNDKDFHQLITTNVRVYNPIKHLLLHNKNLKPQVGYHPHQVVDTLCLTGDDSDNISGLKSVGPGRASDFIDEFGSIESYLTEEKWDDKRHKLFPLVELEELYLRNRKLIDLRHFYNTYLIGTPLIYYKGVKAPVFNQKLLFKLCQKYSIKMFKTEQFIKQFKTKSK